MHGLGLVGLGLGLVGLWPLRSHSKNLPVIGRRPWRRLVARSTMASCFRVSRVNDRMKK